MINKLLNDITIDPRIPLSCQIVTAADSGFFLGLQLLVGSVQRTHGVKINVVNLGLTRDQIAWLHKHGVAVWGEPVLIYPKQYSHWQQWNKPIFIKEFKGRVIWIDADCFVRRSLEWFDELTKLRPTCCTCTAAAMYVGEQGVDACLRNHKKLYERYPVPRRLDDLPNNGVIGLDLDRDKELIDAWAYMCAEAGKYPELRSYLRFWDQGAWQWALEKTGNTNILLQDKRWNDAQSVFGPCTLPTFCERVQKAKTNVLHFAGNQKAYHGLGVDQLDIHLRTRKDLTLFVLDHNRPNPINQIKPAPHIQQINLDELGGPEELAESRIYLSDVLDRCETDFIGLCSASWNTKYRHVCRTVERLHELRLDPRVVWAGCLAPEDWPDESDRQHPGIMAPIKELAEACGAKQLYRQSVWNNNFICSKEVIFDFLDFWRQSFEWMKARYGQFVPFDNLRYDYNDQQRFGRTRRWAYVAERFALLYFANRHDLTVKQIPF